MKYIFILALLLTGCAANGPKFNESSVAVDKAGAKLIIYRLSHFTGSLTGWNINAGNGQCSLHYESYWMQDIAPGIVDITAEHWGAPGTTRASIKADKNQTYYVRVDIDENKNLSGIIGGAVGYFLAEGVSSTGGPFVLTLVAPVQAKSDLANLNQDCI